MPSRSLIAAMGAFVGLLLATPGQAAQAWKITQITDNAVNDRMPSISGSSITWEAWDGNDFEIFYWDGSTITQVTDNDRPDLFPDVSGDKVVWQHQPSGGDYEVFLWQAGVGETQITNNGLFNGTPAISGSNVVWVGGDGGGFTEIFFWDGSTTTQISNGDLPLNPDISGSNVVWDDGNEIYFWDGSTVTQVTNDSDGDQLPVISGSKVAWQGELVGALSVWFWDGSTPTQIVDNGDPGGIWGDYIVWRARIGSGPHEIFFWDGSHAIRLTYDSIEQLRPDVFGTSVVWAASDGNDTEIYLATQAAFVPALPLWGILATATLVGIAGWRAAGHTTR